MNKKYTKNKNINFGQTYMKTHKRDIKKNLKVWKGLIMNSLRVIIWMILKLDFLHFFQNPIKIQEMFSKKINEFQRLLRIL